MPSPKAILHDLLKLGLRTDKSYSNIDTSGHIKPIVNIEPMNTTKVVFQKEDLKDLHKNSLKEEIVDVIEEHLIQEPIKEMSSENNKIVDIEEKQNEVESKLKQPRNNKKDKKDKKTK